MATTGVFTFEDYPDQEFRCRLSPVSMGAFFDFLDAWDAVQTITDMRSVIGTFVELAAPTWTTGESAFMDLDQALIKAIVAAWIRAMREVPLPLPAGSSGIERSPEHSTPTLAAASAHRPRSQGRRRSTTS